MIDYNHQFLLFMTLLGLIHPLMMKQLSTKFRQNSEMTLVLGDQQKLRGKLRTGTGGNDRDVKMSRLFICYLLTLHKRLRSLSA